MIIPPYLKKGDCVRLVSPAGVIQPELINGAETYLISWGLTVIRGENVAGKNGRFSGTQAERLNDLQEALDDPHCKAIFCTRGGYGVVHLIDKLNLDGFRAHPKWLIGYSDITMLHAVLQREGFASIHGGMVKMLAEQTGLNASEPAQLLKQLLFGSSIEYDIAPHPLNRIGETMGTLIGGNLSILYSLRGTPFEYIPAGSILLIEDIGEDPYKIDRIMHNLKLGGILKNLSGLIVGQFSDYEEDPTFGKTVYEIIADAVSEYAYPVCFNFPFGHVDRNLPVVLGRTGTLSVFQNKSKLS